jgi:hypothetical protein
LIGFIFQGAIPNKAVTSLCFTMFSACCSSRRFVELCHGLLAWFDGPTADPEKVRQLSEKVLDKESNINLLDCVARKASFGPAKTPALRDKLQKDILSKFPKSSVKNHDNRKPSHQLAIMRYVVPSLFVNHTGNKIDTTKKAKPNSTRRKPLNDPLVATHDKKAASSLLAASSISGNTRKQPPPIKAQCPTVLDVLVTAAPTNLDLQNFAQSATGDSPPTSSASYESHCSEMEKRFDRKLCRLATANEVAPLAPRVCVESEPCGTNMHCDPSEFCLLRGLKKLTHGFKCDNLGLEPSVGKASPSVEIPMSVSAATNDVAMIRASLDLLLMNATAFFLFSTVAPNCLVEACCFDWPKRSFVGACNGASMVRSFEMN